MRSADARLASTNRSLAPVRGAGDGAGGVATTTAGAPAVAAPASARGAVALGFAGFCAFLNVYATQPLLPLLRETFGVSVAAVGLTVSAPGIAVALASPFVGAVADRIGARRIMVASLFALVLPTALAATATSVPALVAWRFAQGLAVPGVYAGGIAYASARWQGKGTGEAMAAIVTGNVLGGFVGRAVSGVAAEHAGWRASFLALALLTAAGAAATRSWLPAGAVRSAPAPRPVAALRALAARWRDASLAATFAIGFTVLFTQVAVFTYVTYYLSAPPFRLGSAALSSIFAVYLVGAAVTPVAGRWIGRAGARRTMAVALAGGIAGGGLLVSHALPAVVAGLALTCTASFVAQSAATSHLQRAAPPELRSVASGFYVSCYYLGGAAGGVLPAFAWRAGGWSACVALAVAVELVTLGLAARFWAPAGEERRTSGSLPIRGLRRRG
jgi:MFS transporter, YNFM family, putative membrane transport protein